MRGLEQVTVSGARGRVGPLSVDHIGGLIEAVKDGELWKLWYTSVPKAEDMRKEIDRRLGLQAAGSLLPWTGFVADRKIPRIPPHINVHPPQRPALNLSTLDAPPPHSTPHHTPLK